MESELSKFRKGKMLRYYLLGFIDAEGCFSVSLKKQETTRFGWVLDPVFQVTQHNDHREILDMIKSEMSCGRVMPKPGQEDCLIFVVDNRRQLIEKVVPFFENYKPIAKKRDFEAFKNIVFGLERKEHADKESFRRLIETAFKMNSEGKQRRYALHEVLESLEKQTGSSETVRQTPKGDDTVRLSQ